MRKLFCLFLFASLKIFCQQSKWIVTKDSDLTFLKNQKEMCDFFEVPEIQNINSNFIFRYWTDSYILEITKTNNKILGKLFFAVENTNIKNDYFRKEFALNKIIAEEIFYKINDENFKLPNLKWENGFDGKLFIYEIKNFNFYDYKLYATCCNDIAKAEKYLELNDFISSSIHIKEFSNQFSNEIPFVCYKNYNGPYATCKVEKLKIKKGIRKKRLIKYLTQ